MGNTIWGVGVGVGDNHPLPLLPEEVLIEILLWLPVKSLLRFKSVCKSWRDLIHSPFFIHLHTTNTFNPSSSNSKQIGVGGGGDAFILQPCFGSLYKGGSCGEMDRDMFMLSFESGGSSGDDDQVVVFKLDNLGFPPYYNKVLPIYSSSYRIHMVGSCNGLICLHDVNRREVSLWNPATRQFRILPKSITIPEEEEEEEEYDEDGISTYSYEPYDVVALGFDVKTKDYKVVQITWVGLNYISQWRPEYICRVQVYSLSTDSWRLLEGITCLPARPIHILNRNQVGLYLNGSYFFLGRKRPTKPLSIEEMNELGTPRNDSLMISFDFTKEIFTTMQFPDHDDRYDLFITHLGDKIALFTTRMESSSSSFGPGGDEYYDIWVLNEQGGEVNKESWAKLHSYQIKDRGARWIQPRGILNDGEFAMIETEIYFPDNDFDEVHLNGLQLLNLVSKEPKKSFRIYDKVLRAAVYKHSLVSITGEKGAAAAAAANRVVGDVMRPIVT